MEGNQGSVLFDRAELWKALIAEVSAERRSVVATAVFIASRREAPSSSAASQPLVEYWGHAMRGSYLIVLPIDAERCAIRSISGGAQLTILYHGITHLNLDATETMVELVCRGDCITRTHPLPPHTKMAMGPQASSSLSHHERQKDMKSGADPDTEDDDQAAWRYFRFYCDALWNCETFTGTTASCPTPARVLYDALRPHVMVRAGGDVVLSPIRRFLPPRAAMSHQSSSDGTELLFTVEEGEKDLGMMLMATLSEWQRWLMVRMEFKRLDVSAREGGRPSIAEVLGYTGRPSEPMEAEVYDWIDAATVMQEQEEDDDRMEIEYGPTLTC